MSQHTSYSSLLLLKPVWGVFLSLALKIPSIAWPTLHHFHQVLSWACKIAILVSQKLLTTNNFICLTYLYSSRDRELTTYCSSSVKHWTGLNNKVIFLNLNSISLSLHSPECSPLNTLHVQCSTSLQNSQRDSPSGGESESIVSSF